MRRISTIGKRTRHVLCPIQTRKATTLSIPRPSTLPPISLLSKPSPIASSSKYTLDDVFLPPREHADPVVASLQYATDAELYHALLFPYSPEIYDHLPYHLRKYAKRASASDAEWTSSIDPSHAFLALRERATYRQLLDYIGPCLERIYTALRPSGTHEILASDVYLHHRDPRVLRTLLEVATKAKGRAKQSLRGNMIISIYAAIRKRPSAPRLSAAVLKVVIGALIESEENIDLLQMAWEDSLFVSRREDPPWQLYSVPLYLANSGHLDIAVEQMNRLRGEMYTRNSTRTPIEEASPEARHLAIMSTCLLTAIRLEYHRASLEIASQIVAMCPGELEDGMARLVFRTCQGAFIGGRSDQVARAKTIIAQMLALQTPPRLPTPVLDAYLDAVPVKEGLSLYMSLPPDHFPPSSQQILNLAKGNLTQDAVLALIKDIDRRRPEEFVSGRPTFLLRLAARKHRTIVKQLFAHWQEGMEVAAPLMMTLVACFAGRGSSRSFSIKVVETFKAQSPPSTGTTIALAFAHNVWRQSNKALALLETIPKEDPSVHRLIEDLKQYQLGAAYKTLYQAQHLGLKVESPIKLILAACLEGRWRGIGQLREYLSEDDQTVLKILRLVKAGRWNIALGQLEAYSKTAHPNVEVYKALFYRALGNQGYEVGVRVLDLLPEGLMRHNTRAGLCTTLARLILAKCKELSKDGKGLPVKLWETLKSDRWIKLKDWVLHETRPRKKWETREQDEVAAVFKELDTMVARAERRSAVREEDRQERGQTRTALRGAAEAGLPASLNGTELERGEEADGIGSRGMLDQSVVLQPNDQDSEGLADADSFHQHVKRARALEKSEGHDGSRSERIIYGNVVEDKPIRRESG